MRSRLAILGMLAFGMVLSTGGAGLAVSGFTGPNDNAAVSQYGPSVDSQDDDTGDTLGEEESGGPAGGQAGGGDGGEDDAAQPTRQVEAGAQSGGDDEELPFTGFAAIPILLGGVALLSTGLVMRRRANQE